jgi:phosphotransferase system enzyme I (PtsP)
MDKSQTVSARRRSAPRLVVGRWLSLVEAIGTAIGQSTDLLSTLARIADLVGEHLDMEVCSVYSFTPSTQRLVLLANRGLQAGSAGLVSMGVDEGLTGFAIQKGEPVMAMDALAHPRFKYFPDTGEERYHSFLGVPIFDKREPVGVLAVQTERRRRFTRDEIRLLKAVAVPIGQLLVQLRLLQSLEIKEEERRGYHERMLVTVEDLRRQTGERKIRGPATAVRLAGVPAAPGFGIGRAHLLRPDVSFSQIPRRRSLPAREETARFKQAVAKSVKEVERLKQRVRIAVPEFDAAVFDAHRLMLMDDGFGSSVERYVKEGAPAELALERTVKEMVKRFQGLSESYLQERADDVKEIGRRVLRNLLGVKERDRWFSGAVVLIAPEIAMSDILLIARQRMRGIVTGKGSTTSHLSILAKSLGIPLVAGVPGIEQSVREADHVIVDGNAGTVYVNPSPEVRREYERLNQEYRAFSRELDSLRDLPAVTRDGTQVALQVNMGLLSDLPAAVDHGADGIGLYRTEMAFLTHRDFLTEEEQLDLYTRVVRSMSGRPVTIRTLDLGADKYPPYLHFPEEANPFLGWRSTRISLDMADVFKVQLRAILRTSAIGNVRIMFPLISSVEEIRRVKELLAEAGDELRLAGEAFNPDIPVGIMIEVPSAVEMADRLIEEVDFFSIGTNDLTQYLLAVDRDNPRVASLYEPLHPAVLRAIARTVRVANGAGKSVSLCGEMASDPLCTLVLIGMGLRELSMSAFFIPVIKRLVRSVEMTTAESLAADVLGLCTVREIKAHLLEQMRALALVDLLEMYH